MTAFEESNKFIDFVLQSCPKLVQFEIEGDFEEKSEDGVLRFDFSHLEYLKAFKIGIESPDYYKLNVPGKENDRWLNLDTRYVEKGSMDVEVSDSSSDSNIDSSSDSDSDSESTSNNKREASTNEEDKYTFYIDLT